MTKEEVDELRKKGEIEEDKKLGDQLISLDKFIHNQYEPQNQDEAVYYVCVWCGSFIENLNNIVIFTRDCYHLKCISEVYESEKKARDL
jgi:hypothetical protein